MEIVNLNCINLFFFSLINNIDFFDFFMSESLKKNLLEIKKPHLDRKKTNSLDKSDLKIILTTDIIENAFQSIIYNLFIFIHFLHKKS